MRPARTLFVDARCLQDPNYRFRGIGQHSALLLSRAREQLADICDLRLVGIAAPALPELPELHRSLFDDVQSNAYVRSPGDAWFLQLSPMTHTPLNIARLAQFDVPVRATVVYDFIPYDLPSQYLSCPEERRQYLERLAWLSDYNLYLPISNYSGRRLIEILQIDPKGVVNTGVAVRPSLLAEARRRRGDDYVLVIGGADTRKNVECPVVAHAESRRLNASGVRLVIGGVYPQDWKDRLLKLHHEKGGRVGLIEFLDHVSDAVLAEKYSRALVTVCPSRIEGFSIPVVEANANGCPVLVSNCAAQTELISDARDWFAPDDTVTLSRRLEEVASDRRARRAIVTRQRDVWQRFTADAVAARFWGAFRQTCVSHVRRSPVGRPAVGRKAKPAIAFVGPMPPDRSGVADYTEACLKVLRDKADVHVFTETVGPLSSYASLRPPSPEPYISPRYNGVVSVIGNSHYHQTPMELLQRFGGASIVHDARMINYYAVLRGENESVDVASRELKRQVKWSEVTGWLHDQSSLPTLFLKDIVEASSPAIVHSPVTRDLIEKLYGTRVETLPFAVYRDVPRAALSKEGRAAAKAALGIPATRKLISTFGIVAPDKSPETMLWAGRLLVSWGYDVALAYVGTAGSASEKSLNALAKEIGLGDRLTLFSEHVSGACYDLYLAASDAAVQLRTYKFGGLSGAVLDCISAGLPLVMNEHLADAVESLQPELAVPDCLSPPLVAEKLALILDDEAARDSAKSAANEFLKTHNMDVYTDKLIEILL